MSSNNSVQRWAERWSASRLVRPVPADQAAARRRLELAELNIARAMREQTAGDSDAALIFAEQALINAADALLARDGYSANSHVLRFSYPIFRRSLASALCHEVSRHDACTLAAEPDTSCDEAVARTLQVTVPSR